MLDAEGIHRPVPVAHSAGAGDEEQLLDSLLTTRIGDDYYPGTTTPSDNWPNTAPGASGMNDAISSRYHDVSAFVELESKPPVTWIRGSADLIVSDTAMLDIDHSPHLEAPERSLELLLDAVDAQTRSDG